MQKTAPTYTPPASGHPTDEELAAYIDGNLDKAERQRITNHIAACEDCYFLYSETARFLVDSSPATPEDAVFDEKIVPFPSRSRGTVAQWGAIAALLLVGVGSGAYFQFLMPPPALPTGDMTASLPNSPDVNQGFWLGPTYRGGSGEAEEAKPDETAVRLGVQLVNLQVSLRAGKVTESQDVVARILGLLKSQLFTDDIQKGYTAITVDLANGKTPAQVLPSATQLAQKIRTDEVVDLASLDFGQWVEASRLAALSGNPSFFRKSETQSFLRRLLWRDRVANEENGSFVSRILHPEAWLLIGRALKFDPPTRANLETISDVLSKGNLQAPDYAEIRRQTEKILEIHYPEA